MGAARRTLVAADHTLKYIIRIDIFVFLMKTPERSLRAAVAVLHKRNFGRAADALGVSQPALSLTIADLEKRLGVPLFHRTTRMVQPTEIGEAFLGGVARVLDELDTMVRDVQDLGRSRRGRVVVTCLSSIAGRLMPQVIADCAARHSGLEIVIRDDVATRTLSAVANGETDYAITGMLQIPDNLATEDLMSDPLHIAFDRKHRFRSRKKVTWKELDGEHLIVLATNSGVRAIIDGALTSAGVKLRRVTEASQLATVHGMLEAGMGVSVLPRLALPIHDHPSLEARPLGSPELARTIRLVWRRDRSLSPAAEAFAAVLRSTARSLSAQSGRQASHRRTGAAP
jgi:DNA-binding transcriptional LysR family regulator